MVIHYKTADELAIMREAGRINGEILAAIRDAIRPGVSTLELDQIAAGIHKKYGAKPSFMGYPPGGPHPFPATITVSINEELVHGIPSADCFIREGDVVSIDCGTTYQGFVGDSAFTMVAGKASPAVQRLLDVTERALWVAIEQCHVGRELKDVCKAIQSYVEGQGYSVPREYTGHGVGREMHEEPSVPNWWPPRNRDRGWQNVPLKPGMTLAIEPMVIAGRNDMKVLDDHWTVVTKDGSLCAHFEHSVAITEGDPMILTAYP